MRRRIKIFYKTLINFIYHCYYWVIANLPLFNFYQPVFGKEKKADVTRECDDRWKVIGPILAEKKGSLLDIGCNIGYFSFKAAENGCFSYGIEADSFHITCCNAIKTATGSKNCLFTKGMVDPDYTANMPAYNNVINLSVFHHWVKVFGVDQAQKMMRDIANKCNTLVFETGQSNEVGSQWPQYLGFMGDDPKAWIENFLKEIGFRDVKVIGTFATGLTEVDRYLFLATK